MQFKLLKFYWIIFSNGFYLFQFLSLAISLSFGFISLDGAHATLTVKTRFGGKTDDTKKTAYIAVSYTAGGVRVNPLDSWIIDDEDTAAVVDFSVIDLDKNQSNDAARDFVILFDLETDKKDFKADNGQNLVVTVYTSGSSSEKKYLPIASYNDNLEDPNFQNTCTDTRCQGVINIDNQDFYRAVKYTSGNKIQIGMYISDICKVYAQGGGSASGCAAVLGQQPPVTLLQPLLKLNFAINTAPSGSRTELSTSFDGQELSSLTLNFQATGPLFTSCPTNDAGFYYPGDKKIFINTAGLTTSGGLGVAPLDNIIAVGNKNNADPVLTQSFESANQLVSRTGLGTAQAVEPLENSSDDDPISYQIAFMVRDFSGLIAPGTATSTIPPYQFQPCVLKDVQASEIQGFLRKSSCFLASTSFGGPQAYPVRILREFRNRAMRDNLVGRILLNWYYSWSPQAAHWVENHPELKPFFAAGLLPIFIFAWFYLHPIIFLIFLGLGLVTLIKHVSH